MFRLRPSHAWQSGGTRTPGAAEGQLRTATSRWASLRSLFTHGLRTRPPTGSGRRASDSLGRGTTGSSSWQQLLGPAGEPIRIAFSPGDWVSPQENTQLMELHDGADTLITDLTQADTAIAALQADAARSGHGTDLSLTARQSFARVDSEMQRWALRAEEVERANDPRDLVAFNRSTGSLFAGPMHYVRSLWQRALQGPKVQPQRILPTSVREQRRANIRQDLQRLTAPASRLRQHEVRLKALQAGTLDSLRARMNALSRPRNSDLRQVALTRLANIHDRVDHMAQELNHHRAETGTRVQQRLERRRQPRTADPLPAPVLKPKQRQDETV